MKTIRIYDRRGALLRALNDVDTAVIDTRGALNITTSATSEPDDVRRTRVTIAEGFWSVMEEWTAPADDEPADEPTEPTDPNRAAAMIPAPRMPGDTVGIIRDPLAMSDRYRVKQAMQTYCQCAAIRKQLGTDGPWPYGVAQHHPGCPRHPSSYNRHTGPCGAFRMVDGTIPLIGSACVLPWGHAGEHATSTDVEEGQPSARALPAGITTTADRPRAELVAAGLLRRAGFTGAADRLAPAPEPEPEPEPATLPEPAPVDGQLVNTGRGEWFRETVAVKPQCCVPAPRSFPGSECERPADHDGAHAAYRVPTREEEGGLIQW